MKSPISILFCLCILACQSRPQPTTIAFADTVQTIQATHGKTVQTAYTFTNTGTHELTIKSVHSSCGCTVAQYPKTAIPAGKTGQIILSYTPKKDSGAIQEAILIETNTQPLLHTLHLQGHIQPLAALTSR